jgi:pantoate--beta-alanine ligase
VHAAVLAGERDPAAARAAGLRELDDAGVELEYLELVSPETMTPVAGIDDDVLAVIAARVGATRLIDNTLIHGLWTAEAAGSRTEREVPR